MQTMEAGIPQSIEQRKSEVMRYEKTNIKIDNQIMTQEMLSSAFTTVSISAYSKVATRYLRKSRPCVSKAHLVEPRLKLVHLVISKAGESERISAKKSRVSSIEAASQSSGEDHASGRNANDLEAAGSGGSKGELSAIERLVARVEVVLRDGVERVGLAALVNAATTDGGTENITDNSGAGLEETVASEAFAVERLPGFDR